MRLRQTHLFTPMLAAILVAVSLVGGSLTQSASAHHGARITIHYAYCSSDVADIFGECHENRLYEGAFSVAGVWRTTVNGVVSWTPGAGTHVIAQHAEVFGSAYVYCSNQVTGDVLWNGPIYDQPAVTITTTVGQEVICDWYNLDLLDDAPDDDAFEDDLLDDLPPPRQPRDDRT